MNELWVARDHYRRLFAFCEIPEMDNETGKWFSEGEKFPLPCGKFPNLLPGQCRRLVMESEASEWATRRR